jgi:hypothetical protein
VGKASPGNIYIPPSQAGDISGCIQLDANPDVDELLQVNLQQLVDDDTSCCLARKE